MSGELVAAMIGAFGVSEATGTTNLTAIGSGGDGDEEDGNPLSSIPGLAPPGPNGGPAIDLSGLSLGGGGRSGTVQRVSEIVQVPTGSGGGSGSGGEQGGGPSTEDLVNLFEQGSLYDADRFDGGGSGNSGSSGSGSGSGDSFGIMDGIRAVNNFDAADAGTQFGKGTGEFVKNATGGASEGIGAGIASVPFRAFEGAIDYGSSRGNDTRRWLAENTDIKPSETGINDDRPGVGLTDAVNAGKNVVTDSFDRFKNPASGSGSDSGGSGSSTSGAGPEIGGIPAVGPALTGGSGSDGSGSIDKSGAVRLGGSDSSGSSGSNRGGPSSRIERITGSEDPEDEEEPKPWRGSGSSSNAGLSR